MQRQRKTVLAVAAVAALVAAAWGGFAWHSGRQVEQAYQEAVAGLRSVVGADAIASNDYQRGIFSSHAKLVLQWTPPAPEVEDDAESGGGQAPAATPQPPQPVRLVVSSDVRHGPLAGARLAAAVVHTRFALEGLDAKAQALLSKAQSPQLTAVRHLGGSSDIRLLLPQGEITDEGTALRWQELVYDTTLSRDHDHVSGRFTWPEWVASVQDDEAGQELAAGDADGLDEGRQPPAAQPRRATFALKGMEGSFDSRMIAGLWGMGPGHVQMRVGQLQMHSEPPAGQPATTLLDLKDLQARSEIKSDGATLGLDTRMEMVGSLGPLRFDALKVHEQYERLDIEALRGMLRQLSAAYLKAVQAGDSQVVQEGGAGALLAAAPRLIAARPSYQMNLQATLGGQTGELAYGAQIQQAPAAEQLAGGAWLPALLQGGALNASMQMPKAWIGPLLGATGKPVPSDQELQQLLAAAASTGYVRLEGEKISSSVALQGGQWTLNGKPFAGPGLR